MSVENIDVRIARDFSFRLVENFFCEIGSPGRLEFSENGRLHEIFPNDADYFDGEAEFLSTSKVTCDIGVNSKKLRNWAYSYISRLESDRVSILGVKKNSVEDLLNERREIRNSKPVILTKRRSLEKFQKIENFEGIWIVQIQQEDGSHTMVSTSAELQSFEIILSQMITEKSFFFTSSLDVILSRLLLVFPVNFRGVFDTTDKTFCRLLLSLVKSLESIQHNPKPLKTGLEMVRNCCVKRKILENEWNFDKIAFQAEFRGIEKANLESVNESFEKQNQRLERQLRVAENRLHDLSRCGIKLPNEKMEVFDDRAARLQKLNEKLVRQYRELAISGNEKIQRGNRNLDKLYNYHMKLVKMFEDRELEDERTSETLKRALDEFERYIQNEAKQKEENFRRVERLEQLIDELTSTFSQVVHSGRQKIENLLKKSSKNFLPRSFEKAENSSLLIERVFKGLKDIKDEMWKIDKSKESLDQFIKDSFYLLANEIYKNDVRTTRDVLEIYNFSDPTRADGRDQLMEESLIEESLIEENLDKLVDSNVDTILVESTNELIDLKIENERLHTELQTRDELGKDLESRLYELSTNFYEMKSESQRQIFDDSGQTKRTSESEWIEDSGLGIDLDLVKEEVRMTVEKELIEELKKETKELHDEKSELQRKVRELESELEDRDQTQETLESEDDEKYHDLEEVYLRLKNDYLELASEMQMWKEAKDEFHTPLSQSRSLVTARSEESLIRFDNLEMEILRLQRENENLRLEKENFENAWNAMNDEHEVREQQILSSKWVAEKDSLAWQERHKVLQENYDIFQHEYSLICRKQEKLLLEKDELIFENAEKTEEVQELKRQVKEVETELEETRSFELLERKSRPKGSQWLEQYKLGLEQTQELESPRESSQSDEFHSFLTTKQNRLIQTEVSDSELVCELENENLQLKQRIRDLADEHSDLQRVYFDLCEKHEEIKRSYDSSIFFTPKSLSNESSLEKENVDRSNLEDKFIDRVVFQVFQQNHQNRESQTENRDSSDDLNELRERYDELNCEFVEFRNRHQLMEKQILEKDRELKFLRTMEADFEISKKLNRNLEEEVLELREQNRKTRHQASLDGLLDTLDLQKRVDSFDSERVNVKNEHLRYEKEIQNLVNENSYLKHDLERLQNCRDEYEDIIKNYEVERRSFEETGTSLHISIQQIREEMEILNLENSELKKRSVELENDLISERARTNEEKKETQKTRRSLLEVQTKVEDLEVQLNRAEEEARFAELKKNAEIRISVQNQKNLEIVKKEITTTLEQVKREQTRLRSYLCTGLSEFHWETKKLDKLGDYFTQILNKAMTMGKAFRELEEKHETSRTREHDLEIRNSELERERESLKSEIHSCSELAVDLKKDGIRTLSEVCHGADLRIDSCKRENTKKMDRVLDFAAKQKFLDQKPGLSRSTQTEPRSVPNLRSREFDSGIYSTEHLKTLLPRWAR